MTEKHKAFCKELMKNGFNATKAYKNVYKCSDKVANASGARLLVNDSIKQYVKKMTDKDDNKTLVTVEEIINGLKEDIENASKAKQYSAVIKARELLGKYLAIWTDKNISEITENNRTILTFEEIDGETDI